MLKFFFDRFSLVVYAMEVAGILFTAGWIFKDLNALLIPYLVLYLAIRFCATKRWYKNARRYEGIELQFKKALISTSYILAITSGVGFFTGSTFLIWPAVFLLAILLHVNIILLYLHTKDKNTTPVNYYSGGKSRC